MSKLLSVLVITLSLGVTACVANTEEGETSTTVEGNSSTLPDVNSAQIARPVGYFQYGKSASTEEISGWDIDVRPDGVGLPPGSGTAEEGEPIYEEKCALCHGSFGEGVGRYPVIAGGEGTLTHDRPEKTVGSFWPYASTLWDYIHRAMPFAEPESLTDQEVYALSAYVLYLNDLVEYDVELNQDNLALIEMPNRDGFFIDDRPDVRAVPCMSDCKDASSIKIISQVDVVETQVENATVAPVEPAINISDDSSIGQSTYTAACAVCHASGTGDSPVVGDNAEWAPRLALGRDVLVASGINGKGAMPPKGGQMQLSDDEIAAAVDYMMSQSSN